MINDHWRYYLILEEDMIKALRYVEPDIKINGLTYSIEFAHILMAAAAEVDVVMKQFCSEYKSIPIGGLKGGLDGWHKIVSEICEKNPIPYSDRTLFNESVYIYQNPIPFQPWIDWKIGTAPAWWTACNHVKHHRNTLFQEATLLNTMNALAGLMTACYFYYRWKGKPRVERIVHSSKLLYTDGISRFHPDIDAAIENAKDASEKLAVMEFEREAAKRGQDPYNSDE